MTHSSRAIDFAAGVLASLLAGGASFGSYIPQGPFVSPTPGPGIPPPGQVPGKEYLDAPNVDQNAAPKSEQTLLWDGAGGVLNAFNFAGTRPGGGPSGRVDALANFNDELFNPVINNQAALIYSNVGDPLSAYLSESIQGQHNIWAMQQQVNLQGVHDAGDLELWGPEGTADANVYSVAGDPVNPQTGQRTSVWAYLPSLTSSLPLYSADDIAEAIGRADLAGQIDVDALMSFGGQLLFSIKPIGPFNGGEVWYWNPGPDPVHPNAAVFLNHGGHLWDSNFGAINGPIDGLEAVATPEPASAAVVLAGILSLRRIPGIRSRRWRRTHHV